jgi:hypothetical protein
VSTQLARSATSTDPGAVRALFREARRRRRRRRLAGIALVVLTATAAVLFAVTGSRGPSGREKGGTGSPSAASAAFSPVTAVWYDGTNVRIGSVYADGSITQRVVAEANAAFSLPLVPAGRRVYWVDPAGTFVPALGHWSQVVKYLDVITGAIGNAGAGQTVFLSADGRDLFMAQTATSLTQTPVTGGAARELNLPPGWYLPGGDGLADVVSGAGLDTVNGIVVQSRDGWDPGGSVLAIWNPDTGHVAVIGRAVAIIDAYPPPGARYSLLAWVPAGCQLGSNCPIKITDTATLSTRTVRSPRPGGFAMGGAFSPGGTQLAVFLNAGPGQTAHLALVDPVTGAVRVAPRLALTLGIDVAWARWLPDGVHLMVGAASGFLVDAVSLSAEPLVSARDNSDGPNYTTAIVPRNG